VRRQRARHGVIVHLPQQLQGEPLLGGGLELLELDLGGESQGLHAQVVIFVMADEHLAAQAATNLSPMHPPHPPTKQAGTHQQAVAHVGQKVLDRGESVAGRGAVGLRHLEGDDVPRLQLRVGVQQRVAGDGVHHDGGLPLDLLVALQGGVSGQARHPAQVGEQRAHARRLGRKQVPHKAQRLSGWVVVLEEQQHLGARDLVEGDGGIGPGGLQVQAQVHESVLGGVSRHLVVVRVQGGRVWEDGRCSKWDQDETGCQRRSIRWRRMWASNRRPPRHPRAHSRSPRAPSGPSATGLHAQGPAARLPA